MERDAAGEEISRLQACVNDLMAVLALPGVWSGLEASGIVGTLLDGLVATLRLEFAYARLTEATGGPPVELVRSPDRDLAPQSEAVGQALRAVMAGAFPPAPLRVPNPLGVGEVTIVSLRLGLADDDLLVVGCERPDFPTGIETLVLRVAANQAVIGLHQARVVNEQRSVAARDNRFSQALVEGAKDYAVVWLDPEGRVASWNAGAERIKQYRADEIIGRNFSCFYLPEDVARGKPEYALRIAASEGRTEDEGWRVRRDGSPFWAHAVLTAMRSPDGALIGFTKVTRDMTEQKQAEQALRESEARIEAFCDNSPNLIFQKDRAGRYLYVNQGFRRAFGYAPEDVIGKTDADLFPPEEAATFQANDRRVLEGGVPLEFEEVTRQSDGGHTSIVHKFPLVDAEGRIYAVGGIVTDITDRSRIKEELDRLRKQLELENAYLHEKVKEEFAFGEIVGQSGALRDVLQQIQMVAPTDAAVMITGESGTGKELVARAIHDRSPRRDHPLVTVNCASVPRDLFESEFFGHVKGSFTGAIRDRTGRFQLADKGTIFLDEVAEIPLELQGKLLRVLQGGHVQRVGEDQVRQVDVRVIAATNRDPREELAAGRFRRDLYYRLCVFPIHLPPLRGRRDDIRLLAAHFLELARRQLKRPAVRLTGRALELLERYDWPGNVRELSNVIERAVILSQEGPLRIELVLGEDPVMLAPRDSIPGSVVPDRAVVPQDQLNRQERDNVLAALHTTKWRIYGPGGAARLLGLKPTTLASRLKRLGIERPQQYPMP